MYIRGARSSLRCPIAEAPIAVQVAEAPIVVQVAEAHKIICFCLLFTVLSFVIN